VTATNGVVRIVDVTPQCAGRGVERRNQRQQCFSGSIDSFNFPHSQL
jgi:hypothetical protein